MATGLVSYVWGVPPAKQMGCLGRLDGGHPRYIQNQHNGHMELDVSSHHPPGAPLLPTSRPVGWLWRYKNRVHIFVLWNDPEVVMLIKEKSAWILILPPKSGRDAGGPGPGGEVWGFGRTSAL